MVTGPGDDWTDDDHPSGPEPYQLTRQGPSRALVVVPFIRKAPGEGPRRTPEAKQEEAVGLASAIEINIIASPLVALTERRPATYLGKGKVEELAALIEEEKIEVAIVDATLTPVQQRNLEKAWKAKVIDRTGLILEIFGARARTREGKLQVDLAQLEYQKSRLVRSWTHLERQRGGAGFMGGPGETQIEADRRVISDKIIRLKRLLDEVKRTRELHRAGRRKVPYPIVALVGYTNAGKSTLFNRATRADVLAADMLFATLDPTMREVMLPGGRRIVLSDTVGFISDLPTHLVAAFRATLEEVLEAAVVVHVRDISHPDTEAQKADVLAVLKSLGVEQGPEHELVEVLNKIDALDEGAADAIRAQASRDPDLVALSALTGEGFDALFTRLDQRLGGDLSLFRLSLDAEGTGKAGAALAWLHAKGAVLTQEQAEGGHLVLTLRLDPGEAARFAKRFNLSLDPAQA